MAIEELLENYDEPQSITQKYLGLSVYKFIILSFVVLIIGIYLGIIFYGTNSLEILFGLQDYQEYLQSETHRLKNENAELQREYFELKEISAK